ncbi:hypothetical protein [Pseudalkalibacillus sp. NRS-1564]
MLSVDSKLLGSKHKLKEQSPEIPNGKVHTWNRVENNSHLVVMRE